MEAAITFRVVISKHFRGIQNVECVFNRFIYLFSLLLLWLLATKSTKYIGEKRKKTKQNKKNRKFQPRREPQVRLILATGPIIIE